MLIALPLILILLTAVCQTSVSFADTTTEAEKELQFDVSAEVTSKTDEYFVVDITVTNFGEAFSGYVRLNIIEYSLAPYVEQVFFAISANDTKTVQMLIPYPPGFDVTNSTFEINIMDEKGRLYEEHSLKSKNGILAGATFTAGILSNKPYELAYLDGSIVSTYNSSDVIVETESIIPSMITDPEYLRDYRFIIIDDYDTSKLDKESIEAIEKWTMDGGVLIIGTGEHYETLSGFDPDYIRAQVYEDASGSYTNDSMFEYYMTTDTIIFANLSVTADYIENTGGIYVKEDAYGGIVLLPFSLEDKGLDHSVTGDLIFSAISTQSSLVGSNIDISEYTIREASAMMQGKGRLSFWAIGTLIFLYIILVGPLLYLILKAMNKREYIWFVIPCISAFFVILLFFIGRGFGTNSKQFYNISIAKADGSGMQHDFISCFDSGNSDWRVRLSDELKGVIEAETDYSYSDKAEDMVISKDTKGLEAIMYPKSAFDLFIMKGISENTCTGGIEVNVTYVGGNLKGTVTNNTPYDFTRLFIQGISSDVMIEDVKAGQTVTLTGSEPAINISAYYIEDLYRKARTKKDKEAYAAIYLLESYYYSKYSSNYTYVAGVVKDYDKLVKSNCDEKSYGVIYRDLQEDQ